MATVESAATLPGLQIRRLARLIRRSVNECELDLSGQKILTEAATGPYVVTPVIAAVAGADVVALTKASAHGSVDRVIDETFNLAGALGVANRITVQTERTPELFAWADVITNSGHVRPIIGELAKAVRADAVLPLMFEGWEIRVGRVDVDLDGLLRRGVRIAGTNERHPNVDVFSYLGSMAVAQLSDARVSAYRGRVVVLCDNPFRDYLVQGLTAAGAEAVVFESCFGLLASTTQEPEALLLATTPNGESAISESELNQLADRWPDLVVAQFWGDLDRAACTRAGLAAFPVDDPGAGHMGVLPSRVGPEPIVRIQTGGLKVGQVLRKDPASRTVKEQRYIDEEF